MFLFIKVSRKNLTAAFKSTAWTLLVSSFCEPDNGVGMQAMKHRQYLLFYLVRYLFGHCYSNSFKHINEKRLEERT